MMQYKACALKQYVAIYIYFEFEEKSGTFIFPTTKDSMNACMDLVGFSTSKNVKSHWYRLYCIFLMVKYT